MQLFGRDMSLEDKVTRRAVVKEMGRKIYNKLKAIPSAAKEYSRGFGEGTLGAFEITNIHSKSLLDKNDELNKPGFTHGFIAGMIIEIASIFYVWTTMYNDPSAAFAYFGQKGITHGGAVSIRIYRRTKQDLETRANSA
jgi:hypothetical protein